MIDLDDVVFGGLVALPLIGTIMVVVLMTVRATV
jgi:hypothetical protein